jgi:hypothetical protein
MATLRIFAQFFLPFLFLPSLFQSSEVLWHNCNINFNMLVVKVLKRKNVETGVYMFDATFDRSAVSILKWPQKSILASKLPQPPSSTPGLSPVVPEFPSITIIDIIIGIATCCTSSYSEAAKEKQGCLRGYCSNYQLN